MISTNSRQDIIKYFPLFVFLHVSLYPVQEGGHSRIDGRSADPTTPAAEGDDAKEIPRLGRVRILQNTFPPEQSSSGVAIAGILALFSSGTDLRGRIYAGSTGTVVNKNRDLNIETFETLER